MIDETNNETQFIALTPADLLPAQDTAAPTFRPDYYIKVLDRHDGAPIDMPAVWAAIKKAGLQACDDTTRHGANFEARPCVINVFQDEMGPIVSFLNSLGYRTDEDEWDDDDDDDEDDEDDTDGIGGVGW